MQTKSTKACNPGVSDGNGLRKIGPSKCVRAMVTGCATLSPRRRMEDLASTTRLSPSGEETNACVGSSRLIPGRSRSARASTNLVDKLSEDPRASLQASDAPKELFVKPTAFPEPCSGDGVI